MTASAEAHRSAALEVGKFLGSREAIKLFKDNGYPQGTRLLPVPENEPFDIVANNHIEHAGRTLVAVYFPKREGTDRFEFLLWEPPTLEKPTVWNVAEATRLGVGPDGHTSSIGMVVDMLSGRHRFEFIGTTSTREETSILEEFKTKVFSPV